MNDTAFDHFVEGAFIVLVVGSAIGLVVLTAIWAVEHTATAALFVAGVLAFIVVSYAVGYARRNLAADIRRWRGDQ